MEPVFDNQIDAVLRSLAVEAERASATGEHIDADAVAAFVENALPQKTRAAYIAHFADCTDCRSMLAAAMTNAEADATVETIVPTVDAAADRGTVPWYRRWFAAPQLAYGMGAIVLVFGAFLLYRSTMVDMGSVAQLNTEVETIAPLAVPNEAANAAVRSQEQNLPIVGEEPVAAAANTAISSTANTREQRPGSGTASGLGLGDRSLSTGETAIASAPALPPPPPQSAPIISADGVAANAAPNPLGENKRKEDSEVLSSTTARQPHDLTLRRDAPLPSAKSGPTRSANERDASRERSLADDAAPASPNATRTSGGRSFVNKNGVWTDTAYRNQQLTLIRRGSDEFKKLDAGLRNIANDIPGSLIVVWKGRAYRVN